MKVALAALLVIALARCTPAYAHIDPVTKEDYSKWKQPNGTSCCSDYDCKPTEARFNAQKGMWEAKFNDRWILIPHERVMKFEAKDGNAHLCADLARDEYGGVINDEITVFCFTPPASRT